MDQKKLKKILYYSLLALCLVVFIVSGIYVAHHYITGAQEDSKNDDLADIRNNSTVAPTEPTEPAPTDSTDPAPTEPADPTILPEYQELYNMNNDLVGWINIPDTNVDYPVMQTPDNPNYYLDRNFYKEKSRLGAIYVREACDVFEPSDNVVIYGHYISNGKSMFANLHKYTKKSFWQTHQTFTFDTLYERHTYQVIAVFKTTANAKDGYPYHRFNDAKNKEEFDQFIKDIKKMDFYETGISAEYGDKLVTLSTCEYTLNNGRLVVVAKRIS